MRSHCRARIFRKLRVILPKGGGRPDPLPVYKYFSAALFLQQSSSRFLSEQRSAGAASDASLEQLQRHQTPDTGKDWAQPTLMMSHKSQNLHPNPRGCVCATALSWGGNSAQPHIPEDAPRALIRGWTCQTRAAAGWESENREVSSSCCFCGAAQPLEQCKGEEPGPIPNLLPKGVRCSGSSKANCGVCTFNLLTRCALQKASKSAVGESL